MSGYTFYFFATVFLTCFGSSMLIGFNLSVLNLPVDHVQSFLNRTILNGKSGWPDPPFLYAQVSTAFVVAGAIGAFSSGWVADIIGRRNGLLMNHIFAIIGGALCSMCVRFSAPSLLFIGRAFIGINCGITIGVASIYLTEIAPRSVRGLVGATHQLAVTIGICLGYLVTMSWALNSAEHWALACGLGSVFAFISLITLPFCPESPRFLFLKKNNEAAAKEAFTRLDAQQDIDTFFGELREEMESSKDLQQFKFVQLFKERDLRMPLLQACAIQIMQQFSGINSVIQYSSIMIQTAGVQMMYIEYAVFAIGVWNVVVTIVSLYFIERLGRRTLLLWPTILLVVSLGVLTITVNLAESTGSASVSRTLGTVSIVFILLYITGFAVGLGPIPGFFVSEIFRQGPRASAYSMSQFVQWSANMLVLATYPTLNANIGGYVFLIFMGIVTVCWVFFFLFMPETKNRTFDEIARDLAFGNVVVGKRTTKLEDRTMAVFTKAEGENGDAVNAEPLLETNRVYAVC